MNPTVVKKLMDSYQMVSDDLEIESPLQMWNVEELGLQKKFWFSVRRG